jgi:PAS domain S-box-containing protein
MLVGIALSALVAVEVRKVEDRQIVELLDRRTDLLFQEFKLRLSDATVPVEALAALVATQAALEPGEFHEFAQAARSDDPIARLSWTPIVKDTDRAQFEATARHGNASDYEIRESTDNGGLSRAAKRDVYAPILLEDRFLEAPIGLGYDVFSERSRRTAAQTACETGEPVATHPIADLKTQSGTKTRFVLYWPIYTHSKTPATLDERRTQCRGLVGGLFPLDELTQFVFGSTPSLTATISLFMEKRIPDQPQIPTLVYWPENGRTEFGNQPIRALSIGELRFGRDLEYLGRTWSFEFDYPLSSVSSLRSSTGWVPAAAGCLLTLLLTTYIAMQGRRGAREARTAEKALRAGETKYRTTFDIAPVGITHISPSCRYVTANDLFCALLGYEREDLLAMDPLSNVDPVVAADLRLMFEKLCAREVSSGQITTRFVHKDGHSIWCDVTFAASADESGALDYIISIVSDISARTAAEEHQRQLSAQLQQAQKMEAIGQLTGGMAHDFNNLLGIVLGNLDLLAEQFEVGREERELTDAAIQAATRGAELTRQLLAFSRRQPLAPKLTYLPPVLESMAHLLRRTLGEAITLELRVSDDLWPLLIDVSQLESALLNLSVNARDAMRGGGRLAIEASNTEIDENALDQNLEATPGDYVAIAVSDTGVGMTPEVLAHVFEPFFTTKGADGTGLGLSMVHGFIKQSGGYTKIYSEPGHGTTVRLYLPRAPDGEAERIETSPAELLARGAEVILVVEDNKGLRDIAVRHLHSLGYSTIPASDGAAALEIIRGGTAIDLLFTDVVMPGGVDGRELADTARRLRPGLKVLYTSGFTAAAASAVTDNHFASNLLSKPYRKGELARRIRAALDSSER